MEFAQIFNTILKERKISSYEMSKKTGISDSLIGYWRKGERMPKADNLLTIANFLEVSTDYLLGREEKPKNIQNITNNAENNGIQAQSYNVKNESKEVDGITKEFIEVLKDIPKKEKTKLLLQAYEIKENATKVK